MLLPSLVCCRKIGKLVEKDTTGVELLKLFLWIIAPELQAFDSRREHLEKVI
jgi:hypothetical protein